MIDMNAGTAVAPNQATAMVSIDLGFYAPNQNNPNGVTIFGNSRTGTGYQRFDSATTRPAFVPDAKGNVDPLTSPIDEAVRINCIVNLHAGLVDKVSVLPKNLNKETIYVSEEEFRQSMAAQKEGRAVDVLAFREFRWEGNAVADEQLLDMRKSVTIATEMEAKKIQQDKKAAFLADIKAGRVKSPLPPISTPQSALTATNTQGATGTPNTGAGSEKMKEQGIGATTGTQLINAEDEAKQVAEVLAEDASNLDEQSHQQQTGADNKDRFPNTGATS